MANITGQVERDGFTGVVYENSEKGTEFVSWRLARFEADRGAPITVTGVTGRNGSPKAAAYNLQHGDSGFLRRVLNARRQWAKREGGIAVYVPGAKVQVHGYDEGLDLTLCEHIESTQDLPLALSAMASNLANVVARGVYALYASRGGSESEAEADEVESIEF